GQYEGAFSRSDAMLYAVTEFPFKDVNDTRYRIMDILGVKYLGFEKGELSKIEQKRLDPSRYQKVWEKNSFVIFENRKVFPRVYFADRFVLRTDKEDAIQAIYDKNINLKETVIVQNLLSFEENKASGNASILSYTQNKITIETETKDTKILVLSDAFYPGWKASVNPSTGSGQAVEAKIYKVNHALRGVIVPRGKSKVVFSYQPLSFSIGILITIVSSSVAIAVFFKKKNGVG
ncbi:MAG: YfhO family protein, partial [Candidatus Levybacteria bacterium]|nr:YfhO family protein [Candidatus Levybacteria bacterium]